MIDPGLFADATVHTTGVNLDAVASIAASVVVLISPMIAGAVYIIRKSNKETTRETVVEIIDEKLIPRLDAIDSEIAKLHIADKDHERAAADLNSRLSRMEGIEEGKKQERIAQAKRDATDC